MPDDFKYPDFRSLVQVAQIEQGRSEVSCVFESVHPELMRARPMVLADDTRPSHFTFAIQVGVQTEDSNNSPTPTVTTDELRQTVSSYLWLTNLEISARITPTMSLHATLPRNPRPDGPTRLTMSQLADAQLQLDQAHQHQDISRILTGVVTNMHCLAKFSREAGLVPYLGHAHYLYARYLKSQINSSHPPSDCNLESVWSLQVELDTDIPNACALALSPSL